MIKTNLMAAFDDVYDMSPLSAFRQLARVSFLDFMEHAIGETASMRMRNLP